MQRSKDFIIGDRQYTTSRFTTEQSLNLEHKIAPIIGGSIGRIFGSIGGGLDDLDGDGLGKSIEGLFAAIVAAGGPALYKQILAETTVVIEPDSGAPEQVKCSNLNVAFEGRLRDLKVATFQVLRFNFEEYFTDASEQFAHIVRTALAQAGFSLSALERKFNDSSKSGAAPDETQ